MSILNKYFDKIYYINLERRKDRNQECIDELKKYNIIAERFNAINGESIIKSNWVHSLGAIGCLESHLQIIKNAKENKYNNILILEDDVIFDDNIEGIFENYYKQLDKNWDILYLSGNHNQHEGNLLNMVSDNIIKCYLTYTTHSYAVKSSIYDIIIDKLSNAVNPVDVEYTKIQKISNCYAFYPGISSQRVGYSDIINNDVNYKIIIK